MILKCVSSLDMGTDNPAFIKGNEYEVMDITNDGRYYYVVTENGTYTDVPLSGLLWKFELIEDEKEENEEREDIIFKIESLINQLNHEFDKLKNLI